MRLSIDGPAAPVSWGRVGMKRWLLFSLLMVACSCADTRAQVVSEKGGKLFLTEASGQTRELTSTGRDAEPSLSHDRSRVVFVRGTPGQTINTGAGDVEAKEIWVIDRAGENPQLLVRGRADDDLKKVLAGLSRPQFSPDDRQVFFLSSAYATSDAVHAVTLGTKETAFISDGNSLTVVPSGRYRGYLLVSKHKYRRTGSYDDYWLLTARGREVRRIGGENAYRQFLKLHARPERR